MSYLFHGSHVEGLKTLKPLSTLHGSDKRVVWLTNNIPYALVYIWDGEHNSLKSQKHITAWVESGKAFYEEQFPNQLEAFYRGVSGYLYYILHDPNISAFEGRESMFYCAEEVNTDKAVFVPDIYEELLQYEKKGEFTVRRFNEQTAQRQQELTELIAEAIMREGFFESDKEKEKFYKMYFEKSWQLAAKRRKTR